MLALLRHFLSIRDTKVLAPRILSLLYLLCFISGTTRAQRKAVRMLVIVVLLFSFCWLPYHIVYMYLDFSQSQYTRALTSLVLFVQWLMFANSACNPVVYAVLNVNFRREFIAMVSRQQLGRRRNNNVSIRVQSAV